MKKTLFVVLGPTAVGKTSLSIQLAKHLQTEIISADSRQFFKKMPIGTAQPTAEELKSVPHHFVSFLEPTIEYSAGKYEVDALQKIEKLFKSKNNLVMTGGSGFYIDAVCKGINNIPEVNPEIKKEVKAKLENNGLEALQEWLKALDPEYYETVDLQNTYRVIRGIEVCLASGKKYSSFTNLPPKKRNFNIVKIGLELPREKLYERINLRVDLMMKKGLLKEVKNLIPLANHTALQTVGYRELFPYFNNEVTLEYAIDKIKQHSRNYAKRQITWFKRDQITHWFYPTEKTEKIIDFANAILK